VTNSEFSLVGSLSGSFLGDFLGSFLLDFSSRFLGENLDVAARVKVSFLSRIKTIIIL